MKIRYSNEKLSIRKLPLIFFISLIVASALRILQTIFYIDASTGFYTGGSFITVALNVIFVAFILTAIISCYLSSESKKINVHSLDKSFLPVAVLLVITFFYDSLSSFSHYSYLSGSLHTGAAFQELMLSGMIPLFFRSIFAFISAIYFIFFAVGCSKENTSVARHKIIALAPVVWAGFRMIEGFTEQISYIRVSDLFYELIFTALMVLFFTALAQCASGVYSEGFEWRLVGFGLSAALIILAVHTARFLCSLFLKEGINPEYPFVLTDFVIALFMTVLSVYLIRNTDKQSSEEE